MDEPGGERVIRFFPGDQSRSACTDIKMSELGIVKDEDAENHVKLVGHWKVIEVSGSKFLMCLTRNELYIGSTHREGAPGCGSRVDNLPGEAEEGVQTIDGAKGGSIMW